MPLKSFYDSPLPSPSPRSLSLSLDEAELLQSKVFMGRILCTSAICKMDVIFPPLFASRSPLLAIRGEMARANLIRYQITRNITHDLIRFPHTWIPHPHPPGNMHNKFRSMVSRLGSWSSRRAERSSLSGKTIS
jgi:hypothetical protein